MTQWATGRGEASAGAGPTLALSLTDTGSPSATWRLDIWARVGLRDVWVGALETASPAATSGRASRLVGTACAPGATAWRVSGRSTTPGASADVHLAAFAAPMSAPGPAAVAGVSTVGAP